MNPNFPIYIVSKGRAESRLISKTLEEMRVPYFIVIEEQEYADYARVIDKSKILVLDKEYQRKYDTFDKLGDTKSKGPGAARNFAWDHSIANGHAWHWVMDDNIKNFFRLNNNLKIKVVDGAALKCMEDFCLRYRNVGMAGPNYAFFAKRKQKIPPFILNTRIYSCNLIKNSVPFRWRGRYNEDTDLSLRLLIAMHPDVSELVWKFGRWHHHVDYRPFKNTKLIRDMAREIKEGVNNYGLALFSANNNESLRTE